MKKAELDRLKAELQGNENYIGLGFEFAKNMIINQVVTEKRAVLESQFNFAQFKDVIINTVLEQQLKQTPLEEDVDEMKKDAEKYGIDVKEEEKREGMKPKK